MVGSPLGRSNTRKGASWPGRALRKSPGKNPFGDAVLEHLDRAAGDHPAARAAHAVLHQRRLAKARAAHDLHPPLGHPPPPPPPNHPRPPPPPPSQPARLQASLAIALPCAEGRPCSPSSAAR